MARPFTLGAVAYDAKVVTIWEGFKTFFFKHGFDFDFVLYSNYEAQVAAHFAGALDAAWNSPLAWLESVEIAGRKKLTAEAIAMRNSDCDLKSLIVARKDSHIGRIVDLQGKRIAVGAKDSPQATLIPLELLAKDGLVAGKDFHVEYFDVLVGKHGDHIGGERDAARALSQGKVDAACMIDGNYTLFGFEGTLNPAAMHIVVSTDHYDHCNFTVIRETRHPETDTFVKLLMAMDYADHEVRPLLDMEGLKQWVPGRTSHYALLEAAVKRFGTIDEFVSKIAGQH
ncbi:MAG: PhnD/SsuA/transferrin family substrate-binding protein [Leptospiraceae bacterium]|nr:PhnD/SsuA/transferrin family substrate-binding protein [Leptospiraceae bacterium]